MADPISRLRSEGEQAQTGSVNLKVLSNYLQAAEAARVAAEKAQEDKEVLEYALRWDAAEKAAAAQRADDYLTFKATALDRKSILAWEATRAAEAAAMAYAESPEGRKAAADKEAAERAAAERRADKVARWATGSRILPILLTEAEKYAISSVDRNHFNRHAAIVNELLTNHYVFARPYDGTRF